MIYPVLNYIAEELNVWLVENAQQEAENKPFVIVENLANIEDKEEKLQGRIIVSLLNVIEDSVLVNNTPRQGSEGEPDEFSGMAYQYVILFTACHETYKIALENLSKTIEFFASQKALSPSNSLSKTPFPGKNMNIIMEMQTLTTEELNQIWSVLKVRMHPFACYKLQMVNTETV
jgi:hypothetical protein